MMDTNKIAGWNAVRHPHLPRCEEKIDVLAMEPRVSRRKVLGIEIDKSIQHKLLITVAPDGYLKRVS